MSVKAKSSLRLTSQQFATTTAFGWILAIGTNLAMSIVTPLGRSAILFGVDPTIMLMMRLIIAFVLLALTVSVVDWRAMQLDRRGLFRVMMIGLISGVEICCFFWSLAYVDASMVAMIKSAQPVAVLLLLRLGGERLTRRNMMRVLLALVGVYFLIGPGGNVSLMGLLLLFASLILYAVQLVFTQWYLDDYDSRAITTYILAMMSVVVFGLWGVQGAEWRDPGLHGWLIIIILSVISTYFARLSLYAAIRYVGSGQVTLLWPLQMMGGVLLSVLFLQEKLSLWQWLGGGLILVSALLAVERLKDIPFFRTYHHGD